MGLSGVVLVHSVVEGSIGSSSLSHGHSGGWGELGAVGVVNESGSGLEGTATGHWVGDVLGSSVLSVWADVGFFGRLNSGDSG